MLSHTVPGDTVKESTPNPVYDNFIKCHTPSPLMVWEMGRNKNRFPLSETEGQWLEKNANENFRIAILLVS